MEKQIINIPAILTDKGYLADGGRRLNIVTNEITDEQATLIAKYGRGTFGFFMFSPHEISENDLEIPEFDPEKFDEKKSPAQRLRGAMYVYYKTKNKKTDGFEMWYKENIEKIITTWKERIDELSI
jgi:hypothetical protein